MKMDDALRSSAGETDGEYTSSDANKASVFTLFFGEVEGLQVLLPVHKCMSGSHHLVFHFIWIRCFPILESELSLICQEKYWKFSGFWRHSHDLLIVRCACTCLMCWNVISVLLRILGGGHKSSSMVFLLLSITAKACSQPDFTRSSNMYSFCTIILSSLGLEALAPLSSLLWRENSHQRKGHKYLEVGVWSLSDESNINMVSFLF